MFNDNFYIDYIKKYLPLSNHTVSWITDNWEWIVIDGDSFEMTDQIDLPAQVEEFQLNNIFKNFKIIDNNLPIPTNLDITYPFSVEGIYCPFFIKNGYPLSNNEPEEINYQNLYSTFQIENYFPYSRENPFIFGVDYNGIFSYFKIRNNTFPFAAEWAEPFNLKGIYCNFEISEDVFHGFPTPKLINWAAPIPEETFNITPDLIDTKLKLQGIEEVDINNNSQKIYSQIVETSVKDRDKDIYREDYLKYIKKYWDSKDNS